MRTKAKYEVRSGKEWFAVSGIEHASGWLSWTLREGESLTTGLSAPGNWRKVGA